MLAAAAERKCPIDTVFMHEGYGAHHARRVGSQSFCDAGDAASTARVVVLHMRQLHLLSACLILPYPALARTMASPVQGALMQGQAQFEILTSKTPLSELAPVPVAGDTGDVFDSDAVETCASSSTLSGRRGLHLATYCTLALY